MRTLRISAFAILIGATVGAPSAGSAKPRHIPRPDLVVSTGAVFSQNGRLEGSFTVRNVGSARAGASYSSLTIRVSGRIRTLGRFRLDPLGRAGSHVVEVSIRLPGGLPSGTYRISACADSGGALR